MSARVRVYMACSLDGFIAGPDDDLSWLAPPEGAPPPTGGVGFEAFMAQVGVMIMGRRTHDIVAGFGQWPYGTIPVLVTTRRALPEPAAPTVRPISGDITDIIEEARKVAGDGDIYLDGGDLIRQALDAGLIDELIITMVPVLLGGGVRLFGGLTERTAMQFIDHHTHGHMIQIVARPVA